MDKQFNVRIIKPVFFRDCLGNQLKMYNVGDLVPATADAGHYWVTAWGGLYKDEAVRDLTWDEMTPDEQAKFNREEAR